MKVLVDTSMSFKSLDTGGQLLVSVGAAVAADEKCGCQPCASTCARRWTPSKSSGVS
jgi:hypothetical protein